MRIENTYATNPYLSVLIKLIGKSSRRDAWSGKGGVPNHLTIEVGETALSRSTHLDKIGYPKKDLTIRCLIP